MLTFVILALTSYAVGHYMTKPVYRPRLTVTVNECKNNRSVFVCDRDGYCLNTVRPRPLDIPYITRPSVDITTRRYTHSVFKNC